MSFGADGRNHPLLRFIKRLEQIVAADRVSKFQIRGLCPTLLVGGIVGVLSVHVGAQDGVDTSLIAGALLAKEAYNLGIEPKVDMFFTLRHHNHYVFGVPFNAQRLIIFVSEAFDLLLADGIDLSPVRLAFFRMLLHSLPFLRL